MHQLLKQIPCRALIAMASLSLSASAALALTSAGAHKPAAVPENYVITPFGYFHPSCVRHLADGDVIRHDEQAIEHADGSFDSMGACLFPHFTVKGERIEANDADSIKKPTVNGWVEAIQDTTSTSYGEETAEWKVPAAPTSHDNQTIYYFPGMEDINDTKTILQPVLGWNSDYRNAWGIASWNCCVSGVTSESSSVPVKTGDTIFGEVKNTCKAGTLSCGSWNITTTDKTSGKSVELKNSSSQHQTFNWVFGNVLEIYGVSKCSDLPPGGKLENFDIAVYNDKFQKITPSWTQWKLWSGLTPQCSYGTSHTSTTATVKY